MQPIDLTVLIMDPEGVPSLDDLLASTKQSLAPLNITIEIVILSSQIGDAKQARWLSLGDATTYQDALRRGLTEARGEYIATVEADLAHPPIFLSELWQARHTAEILIASRYIPGGKANMPPGRTFFSHLLNLVFSRGLDLQVRDMSSGFRLYNNKVIKNLGITASNLDVLQEILVKALLEGYRVAEIPFEFTPRQPSSTQARFFRFGQAYLKTFTSLWKLRNSIASADYDARAYNAMMPPQRYWQRMRYRHITNLLAEQGTCLDVGCGSSRIIGSLPPGSIALDILPRKLRYSRRYGHDLLNGSALELPIADAAFPCVLCSQVVEHIPREQVMDELDRVLQPGGRLILGTPDYAKWQWLLIEWLYKILLPQAYADEHITHYTFAELVDEFVDKRGYTLEKYHYILQGELILALRKPGVLE